MDNTVELLGTYGGDESHAASAWTSTNRDITPEKRQRIPELLKFLAENQHHTPFEKSYLHFLVTADTASHIHIIKHRIGVSVNAESARYKELKEDKFYIPEDFPERWRWVLEKYVDKGAAFYHAFMSEMKETGELDRKRAKEMGRYFLPYANQIVMDVGFNFRSFMHFQGLRNDDHAQKEIHDIAQKMLELVREIGTFNLSLAAFGY